MKSIKRSAKTFTKPLEDEDIKLPRNIGNNYHWMLRHLAEKRNPHLRRGKNLKILTESYVIPLECWPHCTVRIFTSSNKASLSVPCYRECVQT